MPVYLSMLRGINVGGHKKILMAELRKSCEALSFERVQTYVQSGNVIFSAAKCSPTALSRKIEERLLADFGFPVPVISRTAEEMRDAARNNPFLKRTGVDLSRLHITFLSSAPLPAAWKSLDAIKAEPDEFRHSDREIYLFCPNGLAQSKLFTVNLEKLLSVRVTTRNWNTVNKLCEICSACE